MSLNYPMDDLLERLDNGQKPTSLEITRADEEAVIHFDGGDDLLLPGKAWGADAERGAICGLARLIEKCGWATTATKALIVLENVARGYTGQLFPACTDPVVWDGDPKHKKGDKRRPRPE